MAEMFAFQQGPALMTDKVFLEGQCNGNQFAGSPGVGDYYKKLARAAGVDPKGKVYKSGLAAYPGDPRAWVSGRGDVQRLCEERGWECQGAVNVKMTNKAERDENPEPAPDVVARRVEKMVASNPELAYGDPGEVVHKAKESLKPTHNKRARKRRK